MPPAPDPKTPGWYLDPNGLSDMRWWDGEVWTEDTYPVPNADAPLVSLTGGFICPPWIAVIVEASTGVTYENQTGGTRCLPRRVEGYYVPVYVEEGLQALRQAFEVSLGGSGTHRGLPADVLEEVRAAVSLLVMMSSIRPGHPEMRIELDESRFDEIDEAWVPVTTPDGRGILTWENSD
jgi:hypothetical protein